MDSSDLHSQDQFYAKRDDILEQSGHASRDYFTRSAR